ncbi:DUF5666 domain-containing protein [Terriglobus sp.]|uniref:DUF5666 domain-containing protein n=1 Tax=Terriglobus sp. TaxID=1889013 RepID=UPI003B00E4FF
MRIQSVFARYILAAAAVVVFPIAALPVFAQAPAGSTAGASALQSSVGTVKTVGSGILTLGTDKGDTVSVTLPGNVRVLQLAPGSTDLKTAQPATVSDITEGDRVLVSGHPGDNGAVTALRVVLMKSGAIAQNNASRQQDWQRRGSGGVVDAVDASAHTLIVAAATRKETITTTPSTIFRRYAPGSVRFEDASVSKLESIQPGDQVRVRGDKSADGTTIAADEIVSGAFRNVAGLVTKVDAGAKTVTVSDLATKKPVTVAVSSESDLRNLPPEIAARFVARARGGAADPGATAGAGSGRPGNPGGASSGGGTGENASGETQRGASGPGGRSGEAGGGRGGDLSQVISRLPKTTIADLKPGEAVMVVASGDGASGSGFTAVTLLSGVEPLLAASSRGGANSFSISPWNLGGGGGEAGGEGGGPQ